MIILTLDDIRPLSRKLKELLDTTTVGETVLFLNESELEETNGICEPLYATHLKVKGDDAVAVHYGADGDWTRAVLIPESNFFGIDEEDGGDPDQYAQVDEALEWFFK